ncbi:MAG: hypothetical protein M3R44_04780 [Candidatus Eremiobacteraeota bacterium]|nr:hypothetical protein [Candidatus Eremiobacteraeota bacterium]
MRLLHASTIAYALTAWLALAAWGAPVSAQTVGGASATTQSGLAAVPAWAWIVIAVVIVLLLIAAISRRRRKQAVIRSRLG